MKFSDQNRIRSVGRGKDGKDFLIMKPSNSSKAPSLKCTSLQILE